MKLPKKVLTLHDICTLGRCSTVTATAVLAASGVQPCPIISSILSSTVDYGSFYEQDTLDAIIGCTPYCKRFGGHFDAIYTGYLGSSRQIDGVIGLIDAIKQAGTVVLIDPVMGDGGKLYPTFTDEMVKGMRRLMDKADIIMPNMTEAKLLCGIAPNKNLTKKESIKVLQQLSFNQTRSVVITGAVVSHEEIITLCYDAKTDKWASIRHPYVDAHFPGSGDLFASVVTGAYVKGKDLLTACCMGSSFVYYLMSTYGHSPIDHVEGIPYEPHLMMLQGEGYAHEDVVIHYFNKQTEEE